MPLVEIDADVGKVIFYQHIHELNEVLVFGFIVGRENKIFAVGESRFPVFERLNEACRVGFAVEVRD